MIAIASPRPPVGHITYRSTDAGLERLPLFRLDKAQTIAGSLDDAIIAARGLSQPEGGATTFSIGVFDAGRGVFELHRLGAQMPRQAAARGNAVAYIVPHIGSRAGTNLISIRYDAPNNSLVRIVEGDASIAEGVSHSWPIH